MTTSAGKQISLAVLVCVLFATGSALGQEADLTPEQEAQLRINALGALNAAIADVQRKVDYRLSFLDEYLKERNLLAEYAKSTSEAAEEGEEAAEESQPTAGNWRSKTTDPDRVLPLTVEEAYGIALEIELETGLAKVRLAPSTDPEMLQRQQDSLVAMARKRFDACIAGVFDVEDKVAFIYETERWDDFVEWANAELVVREEEERVKQEARLVMAEERKERDAQQRAEFDAKREAERAERDERMQQRWQRKVEAYHLRTGRIESRRRNVYYSNSRSWWRGRRWRR